MNAKNVLAVYDRATEDDRIAGLQWYARAMNIACAIADGDLAKGAGVIAVLSPRVDWAHNIALAQDCFEGKFAGHYTACLNKAARIIAGEPAREVVAGKWRRANKTTAFFDCIVSSGQTEAVCVDRHALAVLFGRIPSDDVYRQLFSNVGGRYERAARMYRKAAAQVGLYPAQLQAICWCCWRREKYGE